MRIALKEKMMNNIHQFTDNKSVLPRSDRVTKIPFRERKRELTQ